MRVSIQTRFEKSCEDEYLRLSVFIPIAGFIKHTIRGYNNKFYTISYKTVALAMENLAFSLIARKVVEKSLEAFTK